ncbi:hypothetical protein ASC94_27040 [Massilia sp. Root418]|jgi:hypothetical protein|uniref:2Fe-2S iron-sulfur cluster-binding protein n=1 Tax=Massilia sp. Root418 TaxID=1736532 RepID=UPI0006F3C18E|nr:2Fe-2S iron-sulfur cluster-binding protein [Massilia sp. Root418]KQW87082.1 hypothetical protein ASC94_27040 [Massilia sp. Root418]
MPDLISLSIDGQTVTVPAGTTVVAAIACVAAAAAPAAGAPTAAAPSTGAGAGWSATTSATGPAVTRRSVSGALRGPLCGMGVCHECRVTIDGRAHQLACQALCTPGMQVRTALAENAA